MPSLADLPCRQLLYAASILSVVSVTATKVSLSLLIRLIHNYGRVRLANQISMGIIILCFVSEVFSTVFQCPLPQPWGAASSSNCPAIGPIYTYNTAVNIMTDLQIYVLAVAMVWNIQSDFKTKCVVITLFSFRVL